VLVESVAAEGYACAEEGGYLVGLDTRLDDALRQEGLARELVRTVQEARKQAGLEVSDRIVLRVTGSASVEEAVAAHREFLMDETLASAWGEEGFQSSYAIEHSQDESEWKIELARVV
jgi:isoleucyl-tRNA synthetase